MNLDDAAMAHTSPHEGAWGRGYENGVRAFRDGQPFDAMRQVPSDERPGWMDGFKVARAMAETDRAWSRGYELGRLNGYSDGYDDAKLGLPRRPGGADPDDA